MNNLNGGLLLTVEVEQSFANGELTVYQANLSSGQEQVLARVSVSRYDWHSSSQQVATTVFKNMLTVLSWTVVLSFKGLTIVGLAAVTEELLFTLQVLYFHAFISPTLLPVVFRESLASLSLV